MTGSGKGGLGRSEVSAAVKRMLGERLMRGQRSGAVGLKRYEWESQC